jgi:gamma-glutamylcyclotransferase (GGCT)/AIG2-like uncharacterized protein YtfP
MGISDTGIVSPSLGLRLFVYGTLKKGHLNHKLLVDGRKISDGHTIKTFLMMNAGEFPVVFERGDGVAAVLPITGELYEIEDRMLAALDQLEDLGRMYDRKTFQIRTATGGVVPAIMYVGRPQYWSSIPNLEVAEIHNNLYAWSP